MMRSSEDIAWVTRCALFDDRRAFARLVDKYQGRVKRFFLHLTDGDPMRSDDLAQETFIKAYCNIRSYKGLASFSTWLYRVAYNVYYDDRRRNRAHDEVSVDEALNLPAMSGSNSDRGIDLARALTLLRPEERTAISLYFMEELPIKKIVDIMDVPEGTVKSLLYRGKQKLGEYLKRNGYEGVE